MHSQVVGMQKCLMLGLAQTTGANPSAHYELPSETSLPNIYT